MSQPRNLLPTGSASPKRVSKACQRCRRQKLKVSTSNLEESPSLSILASLLSSDKCQCDIQRPCTLCVRAGVDCLSFGEDNWKSYVPPGHERPMKRARLEGRGDSLTVESVSAVSLGSRAKGFVEMGGSTSTSNERLKLGESRNNKDNDNDDSDNGMSDDPQTTGNSAERLGHSSSTMSLVEGVSCPNTRSPFIKDSNILGIPPLQRDHSRNYGDGCNTRRPA